MLICAVVLITLYNKHQFFGVGHNGITLIHWNEVTDYKTDFLSSP